MRTFSLLKGISVYSPNGDQLGTVCDICIREEGIVTHLLMVSKGLISKKYKIPLDQIKAYGKHGVIVKSGDSITKYSEVELDYTMHHHQSLSKKNVMSPLGEQLGLVDDVYFLEEVGTIVAYELTDGFFSDITEGKRVIRTQQPPKIGKDAMIMSVNKLRGGEAHDEMSELPK